MSTDSKTTSDHALRVATAYHEAWTSGDLNKAMRRLPRGITIQEVAALARRLEALSQKSLPIPKGIDPYKARPDRRAMRGK